MVSTMKTALVRELQPTPPLRDAPLTPASNPEVASLLDHLAEELAREYVRLMEVASNNERAASSPAVRKGE
jgi:hypothetical protein